MSSAGTEEIAKRSGGDSMQVDDSAALENTLMRLRQRYALHFNLAEAGGTGDGGDVELVLSDAARRRYPGSEIRYRRANMASDAPQSQDEVMVSRTPTNPRTTPTPSSDDEQPQPKLRRRRPAVNEDGTRIEDTALASPAAQSEPQRSTGNSGGWRRSGDLDPTPVEPARAPSNSPKPAAPSATPTVQDQQPQQGGGWRRVKPGEQP